MVAVTSESTVAVATISSESAVAVTTISSESTAVSVAAVATISSESTTVSTVAVAHELGLVVAAVNFVVVVNAHELSSLLCVVVAEQMVAAISSETAVSSETMAVAVSTISPEATITVAAISSESTVAVATIAVAHQVGIIRLFRKLVMVHCLGSLDRK